jgi:uncharacterized repeat protein (TIGR03803 family)
MQERASSLRACKQRFNLVIVAIVLVLCLAGSRCAQAQQANMATLYQFTNGVDGSGVSVSLVQGNDGNIYGTSPDGGTNRAGIIFKVTLGGEFTTLHSFNASTDGRVPARLIQGANGIFYGIAYGGGPKDGGTVFQVTSQGVFKVLYSFTGGATNDNEPYSLFQGYDGNLYGVTMYGGSDTNTGGALFSLTLSGTYKALHYFPSPSLTNMLFPSVWQVGTNFFGCANNTTNGQGALFRFNALGHFQVLQQFDPPDYVGMPVQVVSRTNSNVAYAATHIGPADGTFGSVIRLMPDGTTSNVYQFAGSTNTTYLQALAIRPTDGELFGLTISFPTIGVSNFSTIFELTPSGGLTTLYAWTNFVWPDNVIVGADSDLYGTENNSGTNVIFRLSLHAMLDDEVPLGNEIYYTQFPNGNVFGYYSLIDFPYLCHFSMGWEYYMDAMDGGGNAYLFDFSSGHWFYTGPQLFPYIYDFGLNAWLYYYPDSKSPGGYTSNPRYFYNFWTDQIITQ